MRKFKPFLTPGDALPSKGGQTRTPGVPLTRKTFLFLSVFLIATSPLTFAKNLTCKKSICFDPKIKIAGDEISIRGLDRLKYLTFDLYTAALYTPAEIHSIDAVLGNIPKSLVLHYHRTIKKEIMIKASRDRILKNPEVNSKTLEDRLKQLDAAYQTVKKGDRYELRYDPAVGTSLILNGKLQATIPGEDFQKAFFGIWLSRVPLNKKFRNHLLNLPDKTN